MESAILNAPTLTSKIALIALLLLLALPAPAQPDLVLPVSGEVTSVQEAALFLQDDGSLDSPQDVMVATGFRPLVDVARDARPEGSVWLRIPVEAPGADPVNWKIKVKRRYFRELELFVPDGDGSYARYSNSVAEYQPVDLSARSLVYALSLEPGQRAELILRVETLQGSLSPLDISIQSETDFLADRSTSMWAFGLYFGAVIALVFYNLVLYLNLRTPGHRMYVLAMTSVLLFMGMDSGLLQGLLPESLRERELLIVIVLSCLMMAATIRFFQVFAGAPDHIPRLSRFLTAIALVFLALAAASLVAPPSAAALLGTVSQLLTSANVFLLIGAAILAGVRGSGASWIFLAAWGAFLMGGFVRSLIGIEAVPRTPVTEYAVYVGSVLEAMILALGLSYRVGQLREQRIQAEYEQHRAMTLANQDALTGTYNRRFFENYMTAILEERGRGDAQGALLLLDIDYFKDVNDTHGHEAGDAILRSLTRRCLRELRDGDVLCRLGGDEFAIVLRSLSGSGAIEVARRIHAAVSGRPVDYDGSQIDLSISMGVLSSLAQDIGRAEALRQADQALYAAKEAGRNRVVAADMT